MYFYAPTTGAAMSAPDGCACLEFMSAALIAAGECISAEPAAQSIFTVFPL
ncbi:MAG: hypothetical protein ACLS70_17535 [[Clostridium] symbiosum]